LPGPPYPLGVGAAIASSSTCSSATPSSFAITVQTCNALRIVMPQHATWAISTSCVCVDAIWGGGGEKRHECLGCASVDSAPLVIFDAVKAKGSAAACQMGATQTQWKAESVRKKGPSKRPVHTFEKRTPWGTVTFAERGTGPHNISLPSASACSCVTGTRQLTELVLSTS
jgi:hypothetical protein